MGRPTSRSIDRPPFAFALLLFPSMVPIPLPHLLAPELELGTLLSNVRIHSDYKHTPVPPFFSEYLFSLAQVIHVPHTHGL
mmetsp:Transcript_29996/g.91989  ORF Transcript_29996/g.91989 Transcript_29996/m.91989 type:complete len:81 (-) Transcript_29996:20-262(-)